MNRILAGTIAATALVGIDLVGWGGGPSNAEIEDRRAREKAKAARETWDIEPGESRQVRRARERKASRANP